MLSTLVSLALTIPAAFMASWLLAHLWAVFCVCRNQRIDWGGGK